MLANKQDIGGAMTVEQIRAVPPTGTQRRLISQALDLDALRSHSFCVLPCSARTGVNLLEGFDWLVGEIGQRMYFTAPQKGTLDGADVAPGLAAAFNA